MNLNRSRVISILAFATIVTMTMIWIHLMTIRSGITPDYTAEPYDTMLTCKDNKCITPWEQPSNNLQK